MKTFKNDHLIQKKKINIIIVTLSTIYQRPYNEVNSLRVYD